MTKNELTEYIKENGQGELVVQTIKQMDAEGAPITIEELDRRLHPEKYITNEVQTIIESAEVPQNVPQFSVDEQIKDDYVAADKGSTILSIIAVIIGIILVLLLITIIILQLAPDSSIALAIDGLVEKMTSSFSAIEGFEHYV